MSGLERQIGEFLMERGALKVGFCTLETLAGGPSSADLTYALQSARSAVSFALPLDRDKIRACLGKKSQFAFEQDNIEVNLKSGRISKELALWFGSMGHPSKRIYANNFYRKDVEGWQVKMHPDISHRYLAVRSGVGSFGWSGNVGMKDYGTAIILGSVVTSADLEPTEPVPPEESFCDDCKLCLSACASGMVEKKKEMFVTLGGKTFTHGARKNYTLCHIVCGGFSGLSRRGKWSTWSPGRYNIPDDADETKLSALLMRGIANYGRWPKRSDGDGGYPNTALDGLNIRLTCGNCQIICWGNKEDTKENYRLLSTSGCVIQRENGEILALPPEEAAREFDKMSGAHKDLYQ